jgi:hypothetical protein
MLTVVQLAVAAAFVYALTGLLFAIAFVAFGVRRVDPTANGSGIAFRLIILPGVAALWPLLLSRWIRRRAAS